MDSRELYHHGILGMKWGIRRYQNKDGTLTELGKKRQAKIEAKEAKAEAKRKEEEAKVTKQIETTRARLLKSTDASELYEHRDLLTTAEINERIDRINKEASLRSLTENKKKTTIDYMDRAIQWGKKINDLSTTVNSSPIFQSLMKKLKDKYMPNEPFDLKAIFEKRSTLSDSEIESVLKRVKNENQLEELFRERYPLEDQISVSDVSDSQRTKDADYKKAILKQIRKQKRKQKHKGGN